MHSLGIVQWNSTRRDHPGNPGGVSGSGPVTHYLNYNGGHFFKPNNNVPNYSHSSWRAYENFSYGNSSFQRQKG